MSSDESGSALGSDFAVMDEEYSCDSDGNMKGEEKPRKSADAQSTDTAQNLEERRR